MLDVNQLQEEMAAFNAYQADIQARRRTQRTVAREALAAAGPQWTALREAVDRAEPRQLVAAMREDPTVTRTAPDRPTPITVVATDGSQVYPDRHVEPTCYLINVSQIAFQYGTTEEPLLDTTPWFRYRERQLEDLFDEVLASMTPEVVSAIRDHYELRELLSTARGARRPGRPLVALADGTLIRWMIRGMRNRELEDQLVAQYTSLLQDFRADQLPLCSYISLPGNTEVIHLLQFFLESDRADADLIDRLPELGLDGLIDRQLFAHVLDPGERSATFSSASHIQREYPEGNKICYFYVHIPSAWGGHGEIGRVEMPEWVADDPDLLDRLHSVVLSECQKGDGYPMILSEAHEHAVIRGPERDQFYRMIERAMQHADLPTNGSGKQRSKRRPRV
jgi:hypothetical protein